MTKKRECKSAQYSNANPRKEGFYWMKGYTDVTDPGTIIEHVVYVYKTNDCYSADIPQLEDKGILNVIFFSRYGTEWAGPIPHPEPS